MKAHYLILIILLGCYLSACRKADDKTVVQPKPILVKSFQKVGDTCVTYCTYDEKNRLISAIQCAITESFEYHTDSIVYTRMVSGSMDYQYIYYLNADGLAASYKRIGNSGSETFYSFTYDVNRYKTYMVQADDTSNYKTYSITNGNVVYETSQSPISTGNYAISTIYYTDKTNTLSNDNYGRPFLGKSTMNLRKAEDWVTPSGDFSQQYFYDFDTEGRVVKRVTLLNAQDTADVRTYTYY